MLTAAEMILDLTFLILKKWNFFFFAVSASLSDALRNLNVNKNTEYFLLDKKL